jgi:hypothetical protein
MHLYTHLHNISPWKKFFDMILGSPSEKLFILLDSRKDYGFQQLSPTGALELLWGVRSSRNLFRQAPLGPVHEFQKNPSGEMFITAIVAGHNQVTTRSHPGHIQVTSRSHPGHANNSKSAHPREVSFDFN